MIEDPKNVDMTSNSDDKIMEQIPGTDPAILQNRDKTKDEIVRSEKLALAEAELKGLLTPASRQWARCYMLMSQVKDEQLYIDKYDTFTQWVNALADRLHYQSSNLWARMQAGREYENFVETYAKPNNISAPDVLEVCDRGVAAGTIITASKIRKTDEQRGNDAFMKALDGKLTKHAIEKEWQHVRGDKRRKHAEKVRHEATVQHRASAPKNTTTRTSYSIDDPVMRALMDQIKPENVSHVTAKDMCNAYRDNYQWLASTGFHTRMRDVYMTVEELPTDATTSKHARRMDVCVLSNIRQDFSKTDRLQIDCIENKVNKSDLVRDHKMAEYVPFCDRFWLSVTPELVDLAKAYAVPSWGILTVDEMHKIRVVREAQPHDCPNRAITYSQFLSKIGLKEWRGNKSTKEIQNS